MKNAPLQRNRKRLRYAFTGAWALFRKFRDKDFSYTDCTSFAVMERLRLRTAFAFDRRFAAMGYRVEPAL